MPRPKTSSDRNLLFGVLALQMDFITREQLVAAMNAWILDKPKSLGEILVQRHGLRPDLFDILETMVQKHLEMHGGDPAQSLAALSSPNLARRTVAGIADADVQASLGHVASLAVDLEAHERITATYGELSSDGRFRLLRPHAKGGLGQVYVARDEELHRDVALKEILEGKADIPEARARFLVEAEITGGLEHPGIVPVYGLGSRGTGRPFYAMRFIRGASLKDAIGRFHDNDRRAAQPQRHGTAAADTVAAAHIGTAPRRAAEFTSVEFRQLLGRFVNVCNAVAYAHSRGVLHRDLKPANIMLGKYGETLVVDWGLAKATGAGNEANTWTDRALDAPADDEPILRPRSAGSMHETVAGAALGTPAFMSPEQAAGRLDLLCPRSDIYSLGATLFMLLCNRPPVQADDTGEILRKIQVGEIAWGGTDCQNVPRALLAICKKAMALRLQDRYAAALELAADIEHWLADEPVGAYREPWTVRVGRWARKHRAVVATATAVLLTATIGLAIGLILVNAERNQTEIARKNEQAQRIMAQRAQEKAKQESAVATAVKRFLQSDLLELAGAREQHREEKLGALRVDPDLKVRDLVLRAVAKIDGKFPEKPLVEAEIRGTLGRTLLQLGRPAQAVVQFERERELRAAEFGLSDYETQNSMNNLAIAYDSAGRTDDALHLREETLLLRQTSLGADHRETLTAMNNLALSYHFASRHDEAAKLFQETLKLASAKLGRGDAIALASMGGLAVCHLKAGRAKAALKLQEEAYRLYKLHFGPNHPDTARSMVSLANAYEATGSAAKALQIREESFRQLGELLGLDHPDTLRSGNNLIQSYRLAGRNIQALDVSEALLKAIKDRDLSLRESNEVALLFDLRVRCLLNEQQLPQAMQTAAQWKQLATTSNELYNAACLYGLCAAAKPTTADAARLAKECGDQAMVLLTRAVLRGYADVAHLKRDPDLVSLHERADFQKLLAQLNARK